jgi:hypothetical protein
LRHTVALILREGHHRRRIGQKTTEMASLYRRGIPPRGVDKHADGEKRRMDLRRRRKVAHDLISSNGRETDEDLGELDQHTKELREIDKERGTRTRLTCKRTSLGWPRRHPG